MAVEVHATPTRMRTPVVPKARRRRHLEKSETTQPTPLTRHQVVMAALQYAREREWSDSDTARLIIAWQGGQRMAAGVTGPCVYCGDPFANGVDHINPHILPRWGWWAANEPHNLTSACGVCNQHKSNRTPEEWFEYLTGRACRVRTPEALARYRKLWGQDWMEWGDIRIEEAA